MDQTNGQLTEKWLALVFFHLIGWFEWSLKIEMVKITILDRVIAKLNGKDPVPDQEEPEEMNVETQVDRLIRIASDPYRYVNHYFGWCQFWWIYIVVNFYT